MSDYIDRPWHCESPTTVNGFENVTVKAEGQEWPFIVCTAVPEVAARIVADHGASAQLDAARAALEEVRRYALAVVGASEAYGETESAHLWNEVAVIAEKALWPNIAALPAPTEGGR